MLMMHAPRAGWKDAGIGTWPPEDIKAHIDFMHGFNKELTEAGEFVDAQGLALPEEARVVRARQNGAPEVTDGPFPEAKEFLAGYWIVDCDSTERAYEIAARASAAPGKGGVPLNMPIEVREVMSAPPVRSVNADATGLDGREPAARARAAGSRRGGPPLRRLFRRRGRRAGGAARGGRAVARGGRARQPARLADPGRRAAHDRSPARRAGPAAARDGRGDAVATRAAGGARARTPGARRIGSTSTGVAADVADQDDTLILLFMCCHPALTRPSAIALTLRAVGGLTTAEIANAFLVPEATMAQRISRAKQRIKTSGVPFRMPTDSERDERLERRAARALSDLQRGLRQQHRPEPAAQRSVERSDPAHARRAQPAAGGRRGQRDCSR